MGRKPTRNLNLPPGMRARRRGDTIYYTLDTGGRPRTEISLGKDFAEAVRKWGKLTMSADTPLAPTFKDAAIKYEREVMPKKAPATLRDNLRELANLHKFFSDPPVALDDIKPINVRQYLDWRVMQATEKVVKANLERAKQKKPLLPVTGNIGAVRANREKALFSHIFNFARDKGMTAASNPAAGVEGYEEVGRDIYVDDATFKAVWEVAAAPLRDALDLAYLTGQRPADVLKMTREDIKDGVMMVVQNKTGKRVRISIEGQLAKVVTRIKARKVAGIALIADEDGQAMNLRALRTVFDNARSAAKAKYPKLADRIAEFQFRDLRAKAGTDTEEVRGMAAAKDQLGHTTEAMTNQYVRNRLGKLVKPTK